MWFEKKKRMVNTSLKKSLIIPVSLFLKPLHSLPSFKAKFWERVVYVLSTFLPPTPSTHSNLASVSISSGNLPSSLEFFMPSSSLISLKCSNIWLCTAFWNSFYLLHNTLSHCWFFVTFKKLILHENWNLKIGVPQSLALILCSLLFILFP